SINEESPLVKRLEDFDNSLIESMVGPEEFRKIRKSHNDPVHANVPGVAGHEKEMSLYQHPGSGKIPCVSGSTGKYRTKGNPAKS
ncbi:MAG: hypothetical protein ABFC24_05185, partial [Methanoregulaceae archaeon]